MVSELDIIKVTIHLFEEQGINFSILDVAKLLKTSKRSIYEHFDSKNAMVASAVDYIFDDIKKQHEEIILENIKSIDKLKKILLVYPKVVNMQKVKMDKIVEQYPDIYKQVDNHFMSNWELTLGVFEDCQALGEIRKSIDKQMFRLIMLGIFENVIVYQNHEEMLAKCIEIVFEGLK